MNAKFYARKINQEGCWSILKNYVYIYVYLKTKENTAF